MTELKKDGYLDLAAFYSSDHSFCKSLYGYSSRDRIARLLDKKNLKKQKKKEIKNAKLQNLFYL